MTPNDTKVIGKVFDYLMVIVAGIAAVVIATDHTKPLWARVLFIAAVLTMAADSISKRVSKWLRTPLGAGRQEPK